jgi:hypothetical protein
VISPIVRAGWCASQTPLEGCVDHLYLDTHRPPIPTTAIGCIVPTLASMLALPWLHGGGLAASPAATEAEWSRVTSMPGGLVASRYASADGLHLDGDAVAKLVVGRLDQDVVVLERRWPAFPSWPWQAQAALAMLAWAVGSGAADAGITGAEWPHLDAALDAQAWRDAAAAGQLRWSDNPGVRPRDIAVAALFLLAGGATDTEARAGWPQGPSSEAAERALAGLLAQG